VLVVEHEKLKALVAEHSDVGDLILRTFMARRAFLEEHGVGFVHLIGPASCPLTYAIREFFDHNQIPMRWLDSDDGDSGGPQLIDHLEIDVDRLPVIVCPAGVHYRPGVRDVARYTGLRPELPRTRFDLVVVGAGPGGLASAVYGASEGLSTLVVDGRYPGGQAGTSSKIENYLGFATGVSGSELARQAVLQARKFGAVISNPTQVDRIDCHGSRKHVLLDDGQELDAGAVVIATGAEYRKLGAAGCDRFEGAGVFYAASHLEALGCRGRDVIVIGGGNSAGQAAIFLSQQAARVMLVVRRDGLGETMSEYLIRRIEQREKIELVTLSEVTELHGEARLEGATLRRKDGRTRRVEAAAVFPMIGAAPRTNWLAGCVGLDAKGFVVTGSDAAGHPDFAAHWGEPGRAPFLLETTRSGIFAVGDVRSGSIKRVASAVGEGSMAVKFVHEIVARR